MNALEQVRKLLANKGLSVHLGEEMGAPKGGENSANKTLTSGSRDTGPRLPEAGPKPAADPLSVLASIHEFFLLGPEHADAAPRGVWDPPLMVLAATAGLRAKRTAERAAAGVIWVGRRCWPTLALVRATQGGGGGAKQGGGWDVLARNIFVDPLTLADRVWAIEQGLRAGAVVVADGAGIKRQASRRIQLAAEGSEGPNEERGRGGVCLLARPEWEREEESFAVGRWEVRPRESGGWEPSWEVELIRWRSGGMCEADGGPEIFAGRRWLLEWVSEVDLGTGGFRVSAVVGDRIGAGGGTEGIQTGARRSA